MPVVGVISDTHGLLRQEALALLGGVDHIVHAGDIGNAEIVPKLQAIAPVTAIRGNVDVAEWCLHFPENAKLELFGRRVFVIHDRKDVKAEGEGVDIVISGHSHRAGIETNDGVLYFNPGSAGPRRFRLPITVGTIEITEGALTPRIHVIE